MSAEAALTSGAARLLAILLAATTLPAPLFGQEHPASEADAFAGAAATGTARRPLAAGDAGSMSHHQIGAWHVGWHAQAVVGHRWESGPRGHDDLVLTNSAMASGRRPLGPGWLEVRAMVSLEPAMGSRGYPLLLQTGETADGFTPLVDWQHPHEMLMELSASYRQEVDRGAWAFLYAATVGEPALGPVGYPHRISAGEDPLAPLGHHFLDATHIAHGVLTAGLSIDRRLQLEVTWFNGREPDENRWLPERPDLNSIGGRLTVTPGERWAIQASFAALAEPEQLHPGVDIYRMTASATHYRPLAGGSWSTMLAWGRNTHRQRGYTWVETAALLETAVRLGGTSLFARAERVHKSELFPVMDRRHHTPYTVGKVGAGLVYDALTMGGLDVGLGMSADVHLLESALRESYGNRPVGLTGFTRLRW